MNKILIRLFSLISIFSLLNCAPTKVSTEDAGKKIPENFLDKKDSTSSGNVNWKKYFSDNTLLSLIDTAIVNNFDLLISMKRIEMARSNVKFSKGQYLPFVSGNIAAGQRRFGKYTMDGVGNYDTQFSPNITQDQIIPEHLPDYYAGLQSSWELDVRGKLRNKKKAAVARYLASIEGKNWVLSNLISEVASTYYELVALDIELDIIRETIVLQKDQLEIIELQKETGRANELAVKQFKAQVLNSQSLEINLLQEITENENKLNFLLGRYPQPIKRDKESFSKSISTELKLGIPTNLLANRPDIRQAEFELSATKASLNAARAAFYPSLTINAGVGFQTFNSKFLFDPQSVAYNAFGGIIAPLINMSAIKAEYRNAKANQYEALYNYQKTIINGYVEVYNQLVAINNLEKIYSLKNDEVNYLTEAINTSSELYLTGRATYLEIIITRKNALQSRLELIEIKKRQFYSNINIYKALGGGWR
jgi:multidrug efflux system outer membrane protein